MRSLKIYELPRDSHQKVIDVDVLADGHCLFYAVALGYLLPVVDNNISFQERFKCAFGETLTIQEMNDIQELLKGFDCDKHYFADHAAKILKKLITVDFRKRIVAHMRKPENYQKYFDKRKNECIANQSERFNTAEIDNILSEEKFHAYLNDMENTAWGGQIEISAIQELLNVHIEVFNLQERSLRAADFGANEEGPHGENHPLKEIVYLLHTPAESGSRDNNHFHVLLPQRLSLHENETLEKNTSIPHYNSTRDKFRTAPSDPLTKIQSPVFGLLKKVEVGKKVKGWVERTKELEELNRKLSEKKIVAITGISGSGKTQLAYRFIEKFQDGNEEKASNRIVREFKFEKEKSLKLQFIDCIGALGANKEEPLDYKNEVELYGTLSLLLKSQNYSGYEIFFIFDNVDKDESNSIMKKILRYHFSKNKDMPIYIIITTQNSEIFSKYKPLHIKSSENIIISLNEGMDVLSALTLLGLEKEKIEFLRGWLEENKINLNSYRELTDKLDHLILNSSGKEKEKFSEIGTALYIVGVFSRLPLGLVTARGYMDGGVSMWKFKDEIDDERVLVQKDMEQEHFTYIGEEGNDFYKLADDGDKKIYCSQIAAIRLAIRTLPAINNIHFLDILKTLSFISASNIPEFFIEKLLEYDRVEGSNKNILRHFIKELGKRSLIQTTHDENFYLQGIEEPKPWPCHTLHGVTLLGARMLVAEEERNKVFGKCIALMEHCSTDGEMNNSANFKIQSIVAEHFFYLLEQAISQKLMTSISDSHLDIFSKFVDTIYRSRLAVDCLQRVILKKEKELGAKIEFRLLKCRLYEVIVNCYAEEGVSYGVNNYIIKGLPHFENTLKKPIETLDTKLVLMQLSYIRLMLHYKKTQDLESILEKLYKNSKDFEPSIQFKIVMAYEDFLCIRGKYQEARSLKIPTDLNQQFTEFPRYYLRKNIINLHLSFSGEQDTEFMPLSERNLSMDTELFDDILLSEIVNELMLNNPEEAHNKYQKLTNQSLVLSLCIKLIIDYYRGVKGDPSDDKFDMLVVSAIQHAEEISLRYPNIKLPRIYQLIKAVFYAHSKEPNKAIECISQFEDGNSEENSLAFDRFFSRITKRDLFFLGVDALSILEKKLLNNIHPERIRKMALFTMKEYGKLCYSYIDEINSGNQDGYFKIYEIYSECQIESSERTVEKTMALLENINDKETDIYFLYRELLAFRCEDKELHLDGIKENLEALPTERLNKREVFILYDSQIELYTSFSEFRKAFQVILLLEKLELSEEDFSNFGNYDKKKYWLWLGDILCSCVSKFLKSGPEENKDSCIDLMIRNQICPWEMLSKRARSLYKDEKYLEAISILEKSDNYLNLTDEEVEKKNSLLCLFLVSLSKEVKRTFSERISYCEKALKINPKDSKILERLLDLFSDKNNPSTDGKERIIFYLNQLKSKKSVLNFKTQKKLASYFYRNNMYDLAKSEYRLMVAPHKAGSKKAKYLLRLADLILKEEKGDLTQAKNHLDDIQFILRDSPRYADEASRLYFRVSELAFKRGDERLEWDSCNSAFEWDDANENAKKKLKELFEKKKVNYAPSRISVSSWLTKAIEEKYSGPEYNNLILFMKLTLDKVSELNFVKLEGYLNRAIETFPDAYPAYLQLCRLYVRFEKNKEAIDTLKKVSSLIVKRLNSPSIRGDLFTAWILSAHCNLRLNQYAKIAESYHEASDEYATPKQKALIGFLENVASLYQITHSQTNGDDSRGCNIDYQKTSTYFESMQDLSKNEISKFNSLADSVDRYHSQYSQKGILSFSSSVTQFYFCYALYLRIFFEEIEGTLKRAINNPEDLRLIHFTTNLDVLSCPVKKFTSLLNPYIIEKALDLSFELNKRISSILENTSVLSLPELELFQKFQKEIKSLLAFLGHLRTNINSEQVVSLPTLLQLSFIKLLISHARSIHASNSQSYATTLFFNKCDWIENLGENDFFGEERLSRYRLLFTCYLGCADRASTFYQCLCQTADESNLRNISVCSSIPLEEKILDVISRYLSQLTVADKAQKMLTGDLSGKFIETFHTTVLTESDLTKKKAYDKLIKEFINNPKLPATSRLRIELTKLIDEPSSKTLSKIQPTKVATQPKKEIPMRGDNDNNFRSDADMSNKKLAIWDQFPNKLNSFSAGHKSALQRIRESTSLTDPLFKKAIELYNSQNNETEICRELEKFRSQQPTDIGFRPFLNFITESGYSCPLFFASQGCLGVYNYLLENGFSDDCLTSDGLTASHLAVIHKQNKFLQTKLRERRGRLTTSSILIKADLKINLNELHLAIIEGNTEAVRIIFDECKNNSLDWHVPYVGNIINLAILFNNSADLVQFLLLQQYKDNLNTTALLTVTDSQNGLSALGIAVFTGKTSIVHYLLKLLNANALIGNKEEIIRKAFYLAVSFGRLDMVKLFFSYDFRPKATDPEYGKVFEIKTEFNDVFNIIQKRLKDEFNNQYQKSNPHTQVYRNLVFQGGGMKGVIYPYALKHLDTTCKARQKHAVDIRKISNMNNQVTDLAMDKIVRVAGTSAGAIFALAFALGLDPDEMQKETDTDFSLFLDSSELKHLSDFIGKFPSTENLTLAKIAEIDPKGDFQRLLTDIQRVMETYEKMGGVSAGNVLRHPVYTKNLYDQAQQLKTDLLGLYKRFEHINEKFKGFSNGEAIYKWILNFMKNQGIENPEKFTFGDLAKWIVEDHKHPRSNLCLKHLHVTVMNLDSGVPITLSSERSIYHHYVILDAIRASMAIPLAFTPWQLKQISADGSVTCTQDRFVDGGVLKNFSITEFDRKYFTDSDAVGEDTAFTRNLATLGFCFQKQEVQAKNNPDQTLKDFLMRMVNVYLDAETIIANYEDHDFGRCISLNTGTIGTLTFKKLDENDKQFLNSEARKAVKAYFKIPDLSKDSPTIWKELIDEHPSWNSDNEKEDAERSQLGRSNK